MWAVNPAVHRWACQHAARAQWELGSLVKSQDTRKPFVSKHTSQGSHQKHSSTCTYTHTEREH